MNELHIFSNPEFGQVRTVEIAGEAWLVGRDVAAALGYTDTFGALKKHVDDEDKQNCQNDSFGTPRGMTVINESGLYALVLSSRLPGAKRFRRWVTSEVLPALRRSGSYVLGKKESEHIRLLQELQAETQKWKLLESQFDAHAAYYRKSYENARANRDTCRARINRFQQGIANLIGQLGSIPMIQ